MSLEQVSPDVVQAFLAETGGWATVTATPDRLTFTMSQGTQIHVTADGGGLVFNIEPRDAT